MTFEVSFTLTCLDKQQAQEIVRKMFQSVTLPPKPDVSAAVIYETGTSRWDEHFLEDEDD